MEKRVFRWIQEIQKSIWESKSVFKKNAKDDLISINIEDVSEVIVEEKDELNFGSTNDAFMFAMGVLKHSLKIVFTVAGFEKIHDFKKIHNTLIERDEIYQTTQKKFPEQPLDDVRWLIKVLQKSRYINNLSHTNTQDVKDSLESLRTI